MHKITMACRVLGAAALALTIAATTAFAQQPTRIRGQIEKADGPMLSVKQRDGTMLNVKLADDVRVSALEKASLADIQKDTFIGVAGMPEGDTNVKAFSVHIFLPAQRGVVADRHVPGWDARPGSTMTNAFVESMVKEKDGDVLKVKYKDGEKNIIVTPQTSITKVAPGNKDELKVGAQIIIFGSEKQPDGTVLAKVMYVGRNVTPAM